MSILLDLPQKSLALLLTNTGVVPGNTSPVIAGFTSDNMNPHPGQSVNLTVTASDADGDALSYSYEFIAGSGTITGTGATVAATVAALGVNRIRVTASDGNGGTAMQTLDLTGTNASPALSDFSANIMDPHPGQSVALTTTASDADGDALLYSYEFIAGSGVITGSGASVTATVDGTGVSTVRVTVSDPYGGAATQTLDLTGTNASPVISGFAADVTNPHPGHNVALTTTASDADLDTLTYTYEFIAGSGAITGSGASVTATVDGVGVSTVRVTVSDPYGGQATRTLDLTGTNNAPAIGSFTAAAGNIFNTGTDTKTLTVTASDTDGDTLTYSYSVVSGLGSVSGTTATGTFTSGTSAGFSTVRVTVSDPYGGQATSDVTIKVCGWRQLASVSPPAAREGHSAIFDGSGHIIIFGGQDSTGVINDVWQYTITTQTWAQLNSISPPLARKWHRAIYDGGGNMIVFGGGNPPTGYNDVWQYTIAGQTWTQLASLSPPAVRISHSAIYNGSGGMIIFGGIQYGCCVRYDVWQYDIAGQTWTQLTSTYDTVRTLAAHSAIYDGAGTMIVFGGAGEDLATRYSNVWQYDIAGQTWTQLASVSAPAPRDSHSAILDGSGGMVIFGGSDGTLWFNDVWRYDIAGQTWAQYTSVNGPSARQDSGVIYDGAGNMIVFGGRTSSGITNDVWMYVLP